MENKAVDLLLTLIQQRGIKTFPEAIKLFKELKYPLLGSGHYAKVYNVGGEAVKVFRNTDKGFTNFAKSSIRCWYLFSNQPWVQFLPKIRLLEFFKFFSISVSEILFESTYIENIYQDTLEPFIAAVTPKKDVYGSLTGSMQEAWGRLAYLNEQSLYGDHFAKGKIHYQVEATFDHALAMLLLTKEFGTTCDLNPRNIMYRQTGDHKFQLVINDPFG